MSELLHFIQDREAAFRSQARLGSLYSDFSAQKTLNPDGYTANLSLWKRALFAAGRAGKIPNTAARAANSSHKSKDEDESPQTNLLSFSTGEELGRALELRPYGRPTGLGEVFKDAVDKKEMVPLRDYLSMQESIYNRRWLPTPWEVIRWSLRSLGMGILYGQSSPTMGNFVIVENVEAAAASVLERQQELNTSPTGAVYSLLTFTETFKHAISSVNALSESDIQVLLHYMSRDRPILSYDHVLQAIKFSPLGATRPEQINENDVSVAQIKSLQLTLTQAIAALESRYADFDSRLRQAVSNKQVSSARSLIKACRLIEKSVEMRRANLLQIEESLLAIENAATNVDIIAAMKAGSEVLHDLNVKVGGVEGVERVTDALREEMATQEEISQVMTEPGMESTVVDESEIDEEFEALVRKEQEDRDAADEERKQQELAQMRAKMKELEAWEAMQKAKKESQALEAEAASAAAATKGSPSDAQQTEDEVLQMSQELGGVSLQDGETRNADRVEDEQRQTDVREKDKTPSEPQPQLAM